MISHMGRRAFALLLTAALAHLLLAELAQAQCQGGQQQNRPSPGGGMPQQQIRTSPRGGMPNQLFVPQQQSLRNQNGFPQPAFMMAMLQQQQQQQQQNALMMAIQQQQRQNMMLAALQQQQWQPQQNVMLVNRQPQQRFDAVVERPREVPMLVQKEGVPQENDPELAAARLFQIARELAVDARTAQRNGERDRAEMMFDRVESRLRDVIFGFRGTRAADEARNLLDKMGL